MDGLIGYLLAKAKAKKYTDQVVAGIGSGFNYKGSVATVADLPTTGVSNGDEYTVTDGSGAYAYNGTSWDKVAQRGETGATGATGATGPAGQNGRTYDVKVNSTSVLDSDMIAQLEVIDNVTSTSANTPLSANMGKELQDEINNLKNIGRFLSIWNCTTGLPLTNPTTSPYAYKSGDYYRVGVVADGYHHALALSGTTTNLGTYQGTYNLSFTLDSDSVSSQLNTVESVIAAMDATTRYTATGSLITSDETYTITSVIKWVQSDVSYIALCNADEEKLALVLASTSQTDTITGGVTNYKPNGSSFTIGVASSTVETNTVLVGCVYYYDGTNWALQSAGAGGTVQDVQIDGTTIVTSGTGVANIPITGDGTLGVASCSNKGIASTSGDLRTVPATYTALNNGGGNYAYHPVCASATGLATKKALGITLTSSTSNTTWTDAEATTARNTIGAYTVQTGTSAPSSLDEGVIYFVVED